jgi:uncharacterized protein (TIGR02453 family)
MPAKRSVVAAPAASAGEFSGFTPAAFTFLRGLAANNDRTWFEAHRADYERELREPMKALIEEMDARLATFIPEITGTAKKSMFRIHRDIRFSKDKRPYKTNAACWFHHVDATGNVGQDAVHGGAGFYFQLEPRNCFLGGGVWMPPSPNLKRIRAALDVGWEEFEGITLERGFRKAFGDLDPEAIMQRVPQGIASDHPGARWLKYKSFTAGATLTQADVTSRALADQLEAGFRRLTPFVRWLNDAMGLRARTSR